MSNKKSTIKKPESDSEIIIAALASQKTYFNSLYVLSYHDEKRTDDYRQGILDCAVIVDDFIKMIDPEKSLYRKVIEKVTTIEMRQNVEMIDDLVEERRNEVKVEKIRKKKIKLYAGKIDGVEYRIYVRIIRDALDHLKTLTGDNWYYTGFMNIFHNMDLTFDIDFKGKNVILNDITVEEIESHLN